MPAIIVSRNSPGRSFLMTHRHQIPSLLRGGCVKRSDSILDSLNKDFLEPQARLSVASQSTEYAIRNEFQGS
jgi:hypothetical protein